MGKLWGALVGAGLAFRAIAGRRPRPLSIDQRLAMVLARAPVEHSLTVHWDEHQIPVVEAATDRDLAVGLGIVHAHLRLGQIEIMRRLALGRVAEMIGPLGVELDKSLRLLELGRAVPAMIETMPGETRLFIDGFLAGYNHQLLGQAELPPECRLLGIGREAWSLPDFLTHARLMSADSAWLAWGRLLRARAALPKAEWTRLWHRLLAAGAPAALTALPETMAERVLAAEGRHGSNSFAVAASRTAGGAPLIASDPHLPLALPNPCLIAGMQSPSYRAVGLMMPGVPSMPIGRNPWIAWGGTNLYAQTSDLVDVAGLPPEAFESRQEVLRVRGAKPVTITLRRCPLGPVVSDGAMIKTGGTTALRWVGHAPSDEIGAMLAIARAHDFEGFEAAARRFGLPGLNLTFAGADGRIAHLRAAHVPRGRRPDPDDLILPAEAAWDFDDYADAGDLPMTVDPAAGFVVSANEAPPPGGPTIGHFFAPSDRAERLTALLTARRDLRPEDLMALQRDVHHAPAFDFRDFLAARLPAPAGPAEMWLVQQLTAWDGTYGADSTGAACFEVLLACLMRVLPKNTAGPAYEAVRQARGLIRQDLEALPGAELAAALARALPVAARRLRRRPSWGALHRLELRHGLAALPIAGRHFKVAGIAAAGCNDTVNKTAHGLAPGRHRVGFGAAARHVSDLGDADANHFALLGGQDGWFGSANLADLAAGWNAGAMVTVPLRLDSLRRLFPRKTAIEPLNS
ncbi:penicillin acylase family protein [Zavarzinia sp.]|uniref:penicillin acylase family protein n=1 Tax=Zavarzinia sp. TaxID=2027920 RepID=UPI0035655190